MHQWCRRHYWWRERLYWRQRTFGSRSSRRATWGRSSTWRTRCWRCTGPSWARGRRAPPAGSRPAQSTAGRSARSRCSRTWNRGSRINDSGTALRQQSSYPRSCQTLEASSSPQMRHGRQVVPTSGTFAFSISRSTYIKHTRNNAVVRDEMKAVYFRYIPVCIEWNICTHLCCIPLRVVLSRIDHSEKNAHQTATDLKIECWVFEYHIRNPISIKELSRNDTRIALKWNELQRISPFDLRWTALFHSCQGWQQPTAVHIAGCVDVSQY